MIRVILVVLLAIGFSAMAEVVSKKHHFPAELTRKIIHITGGTAAAFTPWFFKLETDRSTGSHYVCCLANF